MRRCLITTAAIEIAASAAIAIRTGTKGEEPSEESWVLTGLPCCTPCGCCVPPALDAASEPLPRLPWPVSPPPPVLGLPPAEDGLPDEDSDPGAPELSEPLGAVAPPVAEEFAGELVLGGGSFLFPVGLGTAVSYWTPLDSSA
jgi:hypothetical protein